MAWRKGVKFSVFALVAALGQAGAGETDWTQLKLDLDAHALDNWQQAFGVANLKLREQKAEQKEE